VIAFIIILGFGVYLNSTFHTTQTTIIGTTQTSTSSVALTTTTSTTSPTVTTTNTSTSCSGQVGNLCPYNWTALFDVSINYAGRWNASYVATQAYRNVSGNYNGVGNNYTQIVVPAYGFGVVEFCVTVSKMDSSNSTLVLALDSPEGEVNTSLPFGSVQHCVGEGI
jgi:hypothetical protein